MLKAFGIVLGILVLAVGALVAYAATRPDTFRIARSATMSATPGQVFPLINDLNRFNSWNPYLRKDPQAKGVYSGPGEGPGAAYAWESTKVGVGKMTIMESGAPERLVMRLDFEKPFKASNRVTFTIAPKETGSQVTWAMEGDMPLLSKIMDVVIGMDRMVGGDFEQGLANLKEIAERR